MSNRKKLVVLIILAGLVALPYWRIKSNSEFFVEGVKSHLGHLGEWKHKDIEISVDGKMTIRDVRFTPAGFNQRVLIDSMVVQSDIKKMLFSGAEKLTTHLPESMTISFNNVRIDSNHTDFDKAIKKANYWPMAVGYLGAFACGQDKGPSFTPEQWKSISSSPMFNIELSYSVAGPYHIDFNFNIDSPDNWFIGWSGTLNRPSDVAKLTFNDTIVETLYYYHSDQGFNKKRNEYCGSQNNDSFSAYRIKSAEEIQKLLRVYTGKELPQNLINQYQRLLAENIEFNAIFKLNEPIYIQEFANLDQKEFFGMVKMESAIGENEYKPIELIDIDFLELDMETLRAEMEAKEAEEKRLEEEANKPKELLKTVKYTIGGRKSKNEYIVDDWNQAIGKNIILRTTRGRPVFGKLISFNDTMLTVSTRYIKGGATITIPSKDVVSMSVSN